MTKSLPPNLSLENLKKQAKALQKACETGDPEALNRMRIFHPQDRERPKLADCQLVLAREFGFASWPQLKTAVDSANRDAADQFVLNALLCQDDPHYDHRSFQARAREMLRENPSIATANIWSAAGAGNTHAVRAMLDRDPELVNEPGIHNWTPLLCACYSRAADTFEAAELLLDRGADPNAFTMKGNADERLDQKPRRFTALAGVFGGGSTGFANQPRHPRWRELAELLCERGANPADEIALDLNQADSLEILLKHGMTAEAVGSDGRTLLGKALWIAALKGSEDQVQLLVVHHARMDEKRHGKTPWQCAMERGHLAIARILEEAGAQVNPLSDVEEFVSLCLAGDERARTTLDQAPDLRQRAPKTLVKHAVATRRIEAVKLVLDLGFDPNGMDDNAAIHMAGDLAASEEIRRLLIDRGASLTLRDPWYDSTGVGWAHFFDYIELRDKMLAEKNVGLLDALEYGRLDRVSEILERDPESLERPFAEYISREPKPEDWRTPLERMIALGKTEAIETLLRYSAKHPDGRVLMEILLEANRKEVEEMLKASRSREPETADPSSSDR